VKERSTGVGGLESGMFMCPVSCILVTACLLTYGVRVAISLLLQLGHEAPLSQRPRICALSYSVMKPSHAPPSSRPPMPKTPRYQVSGPQNFKTGCPHCRPQCQDSLFFFVSLSSSTSKTPYLLVFKVQDSSMSRHLDVTPLFLQRQDTSMLESSRVKARLQNLGHSSSSSQLR
jgi:hypothetical protein